MPEVTLAPPESPNLVTIFAANFKPWENVIFSLIIICLLSVFAYFSSRKLKMLPSGIQNIAEICAGGIDDFICGIIGPQGRRYVPFIGTLFIYILSMNLFGIIPIMKSPTSSWSTTLALAICVFVYVQYTAIKEFGFLGYLDYLMGRPRGILAFTVFIPVLMLFLHIISELIRPISLSLRLRGNILGEDSVLAALSGLGIQGIPFLLFSTLLAVIAAIVQAVVFSLLTTIYFTLVLTHDKEKA